MTYDEKCRWLRRYQASMRREDALEWKAERLKARAMGVSPRVSRMPGTHGTGPAAGGLPERLTEAMDELAAQKAQSKAILRELKAVIRRCPSSRGREVLCGAYVQGLSMKNIARELGLSQRWVIQIHRVAVEKLALDTSPLDC